MTSHRRPTVEIRIPTPDEIKAHVGSDYISRHNAYLLRRESLTTTSTCLPTVDAWDLMTKENDHA